MKEGKYTEHIFKILLKQTPFKSNANIEMQMIDIYFCCQSLLQNSRNNHKNLSLFQKNILDKKYQELNKEVKYYMGVIYYPAYAYYEYTNCNFNKSENLLNKSIEVIELYENLDYNMSLAKLEQLMNIYKLNKKKKDSCNLKKIATAIDKYINSGEGSKYISESKFYHMIPNKILNYRREYFASIR